MRTNAGGGSIQQDCQCQFQLHLQGGGRARKASEAFTKVAKVIRPSPGVRYQCTADCGFGYDACCNESLLTTAMSEEFFRACGYIALEAYVIRSLSHGLAIKTEGGPSYRVNGGAEAQTANNR